MRTRNEMMPPADAGPVERPVRPGDRGETAVQGDMLLPANAKNHGLPIGSPVD